MKKAENIIIKYTDTFLELVILYLGILLVAAVGYSFFEHKHLFDSIWWAVVTAMTVGYGDTYPVTLGGRIIAIALMHLVPLFVIPLVTARLSSKLIVDSNAFTQEEQQDIRLGIQQIQDHLGIKDNYKIKDEE